MTTQILHHGDQSGQGAAALVRMASVDEATRAVLSLHGQQIMGCPSPLVVRCGPLFHGYLSYRSCRTLWPADHGLPISACTSGKEWNRRGTKAHLWWRAAAGANGFWAEEVRSGERKGDKQKPQLDLGMVGQTSPVPGYVRVQPGADATYAFAYPQVNRNHMSRKAGEASTACVHHEPGYGCLCRALQPSKSGTELYSDRARDKIVYTLNQGCPVRRTAHFIELALNTHFIAFLKCRSSSFYPPLHNAACKVQLKATRRSRDGRPGQARMGSADSWPGHPPPRPNNVALNNPALNSALVRLEDSGILVWSVQKYGG
eukprot:1158168-Pelagomonas_calceolata.AAC.6